MTGFALAISVVALLWSSAAMAAGPERFCYWHGLQRDCRTGCVEGYLTDRCNGLIPINRKRQK